MELLQPRARINGLDGIRALAVLAVFCHHTGLVPVHGGFLGVDVFFVLSGFLITRLLITEYRDTRAIAYKKFFIRRSLRLFPALIVMLLALTVYWWVMSPPNVDIRREVVPALLYFMNWVRAFQVYDAPLTAHTWSLSIEEQFYLVWPFLLLFVLRSRAKPVVVVSAVIAAVVLWRWYLFTHGVQMSRIYAGFDTHMDGLMVGALLALISPQALRRFGSAWKLGAIYLLICLFNEEASRHASMHGAYLINALAAGAIIAKVASDQGSALVGVLSEPVLAWFGTVSYGFYLWHYPVIKVLLYSGYDQFGAFFGNLSYPRLSMFAACFIGSLVPTVLSWWLVEKPILSWRKRRPLVFQPVS
ncbi:MAG: acyltransferase [Pseudoxanthomonas sp.]|nr:acyltransferase [Pseudoxanthomonas sp.]